KSDACSEPLLGTGVRARRIRAGSDVCLLGVGKLVAACEDAARILGDVGVDATVWDVRLAAPLDASMVADAMAHNLVVSVEDGIVEGGVGSHVAAELARLIPSGGGPKVVNLGIPTSYLPHG